jgi:hypothetical protein
MYVACRSRLPRARPRRGPRVGMRGGLLHVAQRDPGIERGGDERVSERVRGDGLADPGTAGGLAELGVPVKESKLFYRIEGDEVRARQEVGPLLTCYDTHTVTHGGHGKG